MELRYECCIPAQPAKGGHWGDRSEWTQTRRGRWARKAPAAEDPKIPDHRLPHYDCFHLYVRREPHLGASTLEGGTSSTVLPPQSTAGFLHHAPNLLYGPGQAHDQILSWPDRRHRGLQHEMRHVLERLLVTNWRREQLSRVLMAWLLLTALA